jgi:2-phosphoglycerate kinase
MNKIILIGGAPTVGKSFLAARLSKKLGIPWISTDGIREIMRGIVQKKDYPRLFANFPPMKAEKYLRRYTPKEIVANQIRESIDVWKGVRALIATDYVWHSFIVEGIAILPAFVRRTFGRDKRIKPVFLLNDDRKMIEKVVYTRGLYDDANTYSDKVKSIEVEWTILFNAWLEKEARKYGYPIFRITKSNYPLNEIKKLIK